MALSFGTKNTGAVAIVATTDALTAAIGRLAESDATVVPFLTGAARRALLAETQALPYRIARPVVGEGAHAVRQDFEICTAIPADSPLHALRRVTSDALESALARFDPRPLDHALVLNDLVVQRYATGSAGISPHRDHKRYVGLVALVPLSGSGQFAVCADRSGANAREVSAHLGDLLLMRAPGLFCRMDRPYHLLRDITAERYSVGLRQDSTHDN